MSGPVLQGLRAPVEMEAAARSALYRRLAGAFAFPTPDLMEAIGSGSFLSDLLSEIAALSFELPLDGDAQAALLAPAHSRAAMEGEYIRLFDVGPGGPPCPLYEGAHLGGRMKIMEELVRFYEHFGLRPEPGDQPDHLCSELEFMHYLSFKEAAALSRGGPSESFVLAQRDFLERHLAGWLPHLSARLRSLDPPPFYAALAALAEALAVCDLARLKRRKAKPDSQLVSLPD